MLKAIHKRSKVYLPTPTIRGKPTKLKTFCGYISKNPKEETSFYWCKVTCKDCNFLEENNGVELYIRSSSTSDS